jgi:ketosteroid isomerase-like protein
MSQSNLEVVRNSYEAWSRGDFEAFFRSLDADIEWHLPEGGINAVIYRGHREVKGFMETYLEAFDYFRMEPERFFEMGDRIVVFVHSRAKGKGSGAEVEVRPAHLWTMRDGKAVRFELFPERERKEALEAVGLSEQEARADPS